VNIRVIVWGDEGLLLLHQRPQSTKAEFRRSRPVRPPEASEIKRRNAGTLYDVTSIDHEWFPQSVLRPKPGPLVCDSGVKRAPAPEKRQRAEPRTL